ncbi:MAG: hypothetical protein ACXADC_06550 [Candidatus Thorarchaeota archaeon]
MSSRTLYTRRMSRTELDIWLELSGETSPSNRQMAKRFIQHQDSMFFLSSIGDEIVGGTAIYRDRTRLAVALISAHYGPDLKEGSKIQIVKSSLPFFRSVTIHHVDAIVGKSETGTKLPFPAGFVLNRKFGPILESLGFADEDTVLHCVFDVGKKSRAKKSRMKEWKTTDDQDAIRDLFWRQNKTSGIDSSFVTLGWEMAGTKNLMQTIEDDKGITAAIGLESIGNIAMIWPVIADFRLIDQDELAGAIYDRVLQADARKIVLPILGSGQKELVGELAELHGGEMKFTESSLMRKQL